MEIDSAFYELGKDVGHVLQSRRRALGISQENLGTYLGSFWGIKNGGQAIGLMERLGGWVYFFRNTSANTKPIYIQRLSDYLDALRAEDLRRPLSSAYLAMDQRFSFNYPKVVPPHPHVSQRLGRQLTVQEEVDLDFLDISIDKLVRLRAKYLDK